MGDAGQACRHRRRYRGAVPCALRPACRRGGRARSQADRNRRAHRGRLAGRRQPRRGPHPAPLRQCGAGGPAHQFLPDRRRRPGEAADRHQIRERQDHRPAIAASALRNLRLFAARGRRAPALRQGGARRHPLVGPAAGLPHRGARPGEGAAGQERGDRAGRRQGRLRAQADAEKSDARAIPGRGRGHLQAVHFDAARHHRQYRAGRRHHRAASLRALTRATTPISSSRRTRARPPSPTSPTRFPTRTTIGWATPSPRAARRATTTRPWASPRAAPGSR